MVGAAQLGDDIERDAFGTAEAGRLVVTRSPASTIALICRSVRPRRGPIPMCWLSS